LKSCIHAKGDPFPVPPRTNRNRYKENTIQRIIKHSVFLLDSKIAGQSAAGFCDENYADGSMSPFQACHEMFYLYPIA